MIVQSEYAKSLRVSADVIGQTNEDTARPLSSDIESLPSPNALPSADRFADV